MMNDETLKENQAEGERASAVPEEMATLSGETRSAIAAPPAPSQADPPQLPETITEATYSVIVSYKCTSCGERCGLDDPRALVAAMQGEIIELHCPGCKIALRLVPPKQPEQSRIIRPGAPLNRHERRALEVVGRKHPGQT